MDASSIAVESSAVSFLLRCPARGDQLHVAQAADVGTETLASRISAEAVAATVVWFSIIGAAERKPGQ